MRVAYIYPGQGSQAVGMGREFYDSSKRARELFSLASDTLGYSFEKLIFEDAKRLNISEFSQPAIVLISAIIGLELKERVDIAPSFVLGHSLGEFSALYEAGAIEFEELLKLVSKRGKLMQRACGDVETGMSVVLGLDDNTVEAICERLRQRGFKIWCANYNSDAQVVVAGVKSDLENAKSSFLEAGAKRAMILNMSVSSHNPLLSSIEEEFGLLLDSALRDSFVCDVISNVTAMPYNTKEEALLLLKKQLTSPVKYKHSIKNSEKRCDLFLEIGYGSVLAGLNRRITDKKTYSINSLKALDEFVATIQEG